MNAETGGCVCGERYGVQATICQLPPDHDGPHDDGVGQWSDDA